MMRGDGRSGSIRARPSPTSSASAYAALAVFVLAILAILSSDDIWLVVLTFVAIGLVAAVIVIDVWRLMDRSSGEPADEDRR
jgi:hypothetical protein